MRNTQDTLMTEIHEIRENHFKQSKGLTLSEQNRRLSKKANVFVTSFGYKLVPTSRGTHKLIKG